MLKNHFKIAWRNLVKNKGYSLVNALGLSIGIACFILVSLYVYYEYSFESYHKKAEQIYRVGIKLQIGENEGVYLNSASALGPTAEKQVPEIIESVRLSSNQTKLIQHNDIYNYESGLYYTEPSIFDVFTINFLKGDPSTALSDPNTIVISKKMAQKYFNDSNLIGKVLKVGNNHTYTVTGIIDNPPSNTSFPFHFLINTDAFKFMDWYESFTTNNFLLVEEGTDSQQLADKLYALAKRHGIAPYVKGYVVERLDQIHLYPMSGHSDKLLYLYIFSISAILLLIIACINYINLSIVQKLSRKKEVGIRKVLGAQRSQLALQYLTESFLITFFAMLLGLLWVELAYPFINTIPGITLATFSIMEFKIILALAGLTFIISILAGIYLVFYLSRLNPSAIFQNRLANKSGKSFVCKALISFQFAVAISLIISTIIIQNQLNFIQNTDLGFDEENIVFLNLYKSGMESRSDVLRNLVADIPGVKSVTASSAVPGYGGFITLVYNNGEFALPRINSGVIAANFIDFMEIGVLSGKTQPLSNGDIILNKAAAQAMGIENAHNQMIKIGNTKGELAKIVGNFNYASLKNTVQPLYMVVRSDSFQILSLNINSENIKTTITSIKSVWKKFAPSSPIIYGFLKDKISNMYISEKRFADIFWGFSIITIIIACMGLFAMTSITAERRTKEIGIRKVMGATNMNIVRLLSKDFLKLVLIGLVIAVPVAWYFMHRWLQDFAYRIDLGVGIFLLAGGLALLIALATVSWQSVRAALANPVDSLRNE